ncbi:hypothetical protein [Kribbella flavida]|uniref:hypothetical protein n=1 Tax=Kribbella flavida TaxID=182640 RepID=UPI00019BF64B|nr:hypothetical protein [Kribbella flavida]
MARPRLVSGFAEYRPEQTRRTPEQPISVRARSTVDVSRLGLVLRERRHPRPAPLAPGTGVLLRAEPTTDR